MPGSGAAKTVSQEDMDALALPNTPPTVTVRGSACLVYELKG